MRQLCTIRKNLRKSEETCTRGADLKKQRVQEPQRCSGYEINSWCKLKFLILVPQESQLHFIHSSTKHWPRASWIPSTILRAVVHSWTKGTKSQTSQIFLLEKTTIILVSVQFSSVAQSCPTLRHHESHHARPPCPSPTPRVYPNSCPSSQWCHPAISSSVVPFSFCPQSLPASGSFPMSQLFAWGGQSIGVSASASALPMNTQDWSPSGWTSWISLQSKGLSRVFSNTIVQKHQFFVLSFPHSLTLTSIHEHWKKHSLDQMDLSWQSNVSAFSICYLGWS